MTFYSDPSFFILLFLAVIPAIALGLLGKSLRAYQVGVSLLFLLFLFSKAPTQAVAFVFYLVLSFAVTFSYAQARTRHPVAFLSALCLLIAPLVVYKAAAIFDVSLLGFLGISYITFKTVQVVIEVHDGIIKKLSPLDYLSFLIFFPPFTSGPIMRSREFEKSSHDMQKEEYRELLTRGLLWFVIGAFYKMVCSSVFSIALWYIPKALGDATLVTSAVGQIGSAYAYGFYLFFDFAGYSLMALGAGAAFGIRIPHNFHYPFASVDIKDFWNRWHITLSFWLRDFVFMRFVRAIRKKKLLASRTTTSCLGYLLNMAVMGLWHGFTPNYIVYGVYHGLLLSGNELFQKTAFYRQHKDGPIFRFGSWFATFNLVMLGFAIFSGQIPLRPL
jgi:membrane protein involved in D-alanine export